MSDNNNNDAYEVVWSGTKDRNGECHSLTGYAGPSSLLNTPQDRSFTENELYRLQVALGMRQPKRSRSEAQRARWQRIKDAA